MNLTPWDINDSANSLNSWSGSIEGVVFLGTQESKRLQPFTRRFGFPIGGGEGLVFFMSDESDPYW
jgi:hypothetical protein